MVKDLVPAAHGLLTPIQRAFLSAFAALPDQEHFYLTGGTALAEFYLGHRTSYDLDFFTSQEPLILPFSYQIDALGQEHGIQVSVMRRFATYVEFTVRQGQESLRVDLALDSPFRFGQPHLSEHGIYVNPWQDLKVDKLLAYYGRAEPRDAVDVFFIMRLEPIRTLLELAAQKDPGFDLYWFAVALNQAADLPDSVDRWPVEMRVAFSPTELKQTFQQLALEIMARVANDDQP